MILPTTFYLFTATLIALISVYSTSAAPTPPDSDACGSLSKKNRDPKTLTYEDVASCYTSIPFNTTIAKTTLDTVITLFRDYYVFRDSALTPDLKAPFSSAPVDVLKELDALRTREFGSDFEFHSTVGRVVDSLHDAHASYYEGCYDKYLFFQSIFLYAPVIKGKQSVRVLYDHLMKGYEDCIVETIDGHPALEYLTSWSDRLASSKDAGVQLNQALASQIYDEVDRTYVLSAGHFAERYSLPETPFVDYRLRCDSKKRSMTAAEEEEGEKGEGSIRVTVPWGVAPFSDVKNVAFDSAAAYIANVCSSPNYFTSTFTSENDDTPKKRALKQRPRPKTLQPSKSILLETDLPQQERQENASPPTTADTPFTPKGLDARKIAAGATTVYYQLKDKPHVGVVVVFSHDAGAQELETARQAFKDFHDNGVTHLIIDTQGNGGGMVDFASTFVQLFFPRSPADNNTTPTTTTSNDDDSKPQPPYFPSDLRVTTPIQDLSSTIAQANFTNTSVGLYGPHIYLDLSTNKPYNTNTLFLTPRTITRNSRNATYSHLTTINTPILPPDPQLQSYKWTSNPRNMILLSNGYCGSACAMSSSFLSSVYNVPSLAVGGLYKRDMSFFTFPGGAVSSLGKLRGVFLSNGMVPPFEDLPYLGGGVSLPLLEIYSPTISQPPPELEDQQQCAQNCDCGDNDDDDDSNSNDKTIAPPPVPSVPLEYNPEAHRADLRLDWDTVNSRSRDVLWSQVASAASWH